MSLTMKQALNELLAKYPLESFGLEGWRVVIRRTVPKRIDGIGVLIPKIAPGHWLGGYCCHAAREIGLIAVPPIDDSQHLTLKITYFHEVAHATLPDTSDDMSHSRAWKLRFRSLLRKHSKHVDAILAMDNTHPAWRKKIPDLSAYVRQMRSSRGRSKRTSSG